jgi:hypothetical protein
VESQLTAATGLGNDFVSSPGSSEEEEESGVRASTESVPRARTVEESVARASAAGDGGVDDLVNFWDDDDDEPGMNAFSSGAEFSVNERCSYYMDRVQITLNNRHAVEIVYMVEAETLCRNENTMTLPGCRSYSIKSSIVTSLSSAQFLHLALAI